MDNVLLDLSQSHINRLRKGRTIQLKHSHIGKGHKVHLHHHKVLHIRRAHRLGKGFRLDMDDGELEASGFKHFMKKVWQGYKKHVKPHVSGPIKKALKKGIELATNTFAPELAPVAHSIAEKVVDKVGDKTGAFGIKEQLKKVGRAYKKHVRPHVGKHLRKGIVSAHEAVEPIKEHSGTIADYISKHTGAYGIKQHKLKSDGSTFLSHQHPAMQPAIAVSMQHTIAGGSFKAGSVRKRGVSFIAV